MLVRLLAIFTPQNRKVLPPSGWVMRGVEGAAFLAITIKKNFAFRYAKSKNEEGDSDDRRGIERTIR